MRMIALLLGFLTLFASPVHAETNQVRIGLQFGLAYLPIIVADGEKLFQKRAAEFGIADLNASLHRFSGSAAMNEALLSNSIDFGSLGTPGLLIAWEKTKGRQGVKALGGLAISRFVLNTNRPEVKSVKDFGDQDKIAVPALNSPQAILLRMAAEQAFGEGQYNRLDRLMVGLPHPDATTALLSGKTVTGYFSSAPYSQMLARDSRIHAVTTAAAILGGVDATSVSLAGGQAFVDTNPTVARAVLAGLEDAMKLIAADPRRAADIYLKFEHVNLTPEELVQQIGDGTTTYEIAGQGLVKYGKFMKKIGMTKTAPESWKDVFFPFVHDRQGS
jgi:NitT/TauT family transport system substrate-binding protein